MNLNIKKIKFIDSLHICLTVVLLGNEIPLPNLLLVGMIISLFRFSNFEEIMKSFNKLYSWAMIDERLIPTKDLSGIDLGHYDFIESQKNEIRSMQKDKNKIGNKLKIICLEAILYVILEKSLATHQVECIVLMLYAIWVIGTSFWTNQYYKHLTSMGLVGFMAKLSTPQSLLFFSTFCYTYFLLLKFYTQFYYDKLASKSALKNFRLEYPMKSFSIFIISFMVLFFLFPPFDSPISMNSITNKIKNIEKEKVGIRKDLSNKIEKHVKKRKINSRKLQDLLKNKNIPQNLTDKIQKYQELQEKLKNCFKSGPANGNSGPTGFFKDKSNIEDFQEWQKLNKELKTDLKKYSQGHGEANKSPNSLNYLSQTEIEQLMNGLKKPNNGSTNKDFDEKLAEKLERNLKAQDNQNDLKQIQKNQGKAFEVLKEILNKTTKSNQNKNDYKELQKMRELQDKLNSQFQANKEKPSPMDLKEIQKNLEQMSNSLKLDKNESLSQKEIQKNEVELDQLNKLLNQTKNDLNDFQNKNIPLTKTLTQEEQKRLLDLRLEQSKKYKMKSGIDLKEVQENVFENQEAKDIQKQFENLRLKEHEKEQTKTFSKLSKQITAILIIMFFIFVFYVAKNFFAKDKIIHDEEVKNLDEKIKKEIHSLLANTRTKFSSIEEEITYCYELFHEVMNKLFYDNNSSIYSPPPSILDDKESLLSKRLKLIALTLAGCYTPIKYGDKRLKYPKELIKKFRNDYKDFLRLSKKLLRA